MNLSRKTTDTIVILTLVLSLTALAIGLYTLVRLNASENSNMQQTAQLQASDTRLRFCHDMQITPCDDAGLKNWNTAHPDNTFNLGS